MYIVLFSKIAKKYILFVTQPTAKDSISLQPRRVYFIHDGYTILTITDMALRCYAEDFRHRKHPLVTLSLTSSTE